MQLVVHASTELDVATDRVFDFAVSPQNLPRILQKFAAIPAIESMAMLDGAQLATGARRNVKMGDGSEILEEVVAFDRPRRHCYRWLNPPAFPFSLMVRRGQGDWVFTASSRGTRIDWTYTFELTSPLAAPFALPVMAMFRGWMQRGLDRIAPLLGA